MFRFFSLFVYCVAAASPRQYSTAMRPSSPALLALAAVALLGHLVAAQPGVCDDTYECIYEAQTVDNITFTFDLKPLCSSGNSYRIKDATNHT